MSTLKDRIQDLLSSQFRVPAAKITHDVTLGELSFDSLVLIELSLVLENQFGIEVGDDELSPELTIDDLVALVSAKGALV
ncbi:acyl carrier protein [Kitasatospora kifunensis]|uniref:Acyl carrier protein n=1 Tax=Kitasatospora kifunensis TaxID=58351 RepID=A0A7W7QYR8_KITKI|nr:acyl carrier protein [Kitasatospora kifunensis]MBB4922009.1 acyl carrier protein [Kitasatospora kifunensis]